MFMGRVNRNSRFFWRIVTRIGHVFEVRRPRPLIFGVKLEFWFKLGSLIYMISSILLGRGLVRFSL